jgi:transcriptional regulator GlxA family with amidase domain
LDPTLHLDQFGELVQVDQKELHDFFELYLFTNFTDEMNRLRVQFAKNLIQEGCLQAKCLDTLHIESGFLNKNDLSRYFVEFSGESMEDYMLKFKKN